MPHKPIRLSRLVAQRISRRVRRLPPAQGPPPQTELARRLDDLGRLHAPLGYIIRRISSQFAGIGSAPTHTCVKFRD